MGGDNKLAPSTAAVSEWTFDLPSYAPKNPGKSVKAAQKRITTGSSDNNKKNKNKNKIKNKKDGDGNGESKGDAVSFEPVGYDEGLVKAKVVSHLKAKSEVDAIKNRAMGMAMAPGKQLPMTAIMLYVYLLEYIDETTLDCAPFFFFLSPSSPQTASVSLACLSKYPCYLFMSTCPILTVPFI